MIDTLTDAKAIFLDALDCTSPDEINRFLDKACRSDTSLRKSVEKLLQAHRQAGAFLGGANEIDTRFDQPNTLSPGTRIGPYFLRELIGEGGMGLVFVADQEQPVRRRVALKVVKPGMDTRQVLARFEAERQALALMDHPNIAKVLDANTTSSPLSPPGRGAGGEGILNQSSYEGLKQDYLQEEPLTLSLSPGGRGNQNAGRPYFVMELVRGVPITDYCDQARLTPRQRLELFLPVCRAIQHAHQKGVIHRDIKPSNLLVTLYDSHPVPKVIDFGIAKAVGPEFADHSVYTGFAQLVGTPMYMSPEQAEMTAQDVDTRADVYALGVVLYELLTGTTPFDAETLRRVGFDEMRRIIREDEPAKPSQRVATLSAEKQSTVTGQRGVDSRQLGRQLRSGLDWVVMTCLAKDRTRRYESAGALAADIERYLRDEAVEACPPSTSYRVRTFARRHRTKLAVAALVLFFLMVLGSAVGWAVRDRAARKAEAARQQADRQAKVAEQVGSILVEVDRLEGEQKWPEALAAVRRAEAAVAGGEADAVIDDLIHRRMRDLKFIDRLETIRVEMSATVEGKLRYTSADLDYCQTFRDFGVDVDQMTVEAAIDRLNTRPTFAVAVAAALDSWAVVRRAAIENQRRGWEWPNEVARGIDPDRFRDRLRSNWGRPDSEVQEEQRDIAESIDIRAQHPATLNNLANALLRTKQPVTAIRLLRRAVSAYPGDFWLNYNLGYALSDRKEWGEATRFYTAAIAIRPNSPSTLSNLGYALLKRSKFDEAVACYRRAIELDPTFARAHRDLSLALSDPGALSDQDKWDEAITFARRAIELEPKHPFGPIRLADSLAGKGWVLANNSDPKLRDLKQALELGKKAIEIAPQSSWSWQKLGWIQYRAGNWKESIEALETSCKLQKVQEGSPGDAFQWLFLAMAHKQLGHQEEAHKWYDKAIKLEKGWPYILRLFRAEAEELLGVKPKDK
ncbi:MAG: tetratricopeptide repeat protein [Planctomycetia bacterium]|nr:tetratricopeptide repeat protein [Planctomycetia bacterium]